MPPEVPDRDLEEAIAELDAVRDEWLRRPGVTAVDVGLERRGGVTTGRVAVRVHVARKLPEEALPPGERFPERLGRFPVDVLEATYGPQ